MDLSLTRWPSSPQVFGAIDRGRPGSIGKAELGGYLSQHGWGEAEVRALWAHLCAGRNPGGQASVGLRRFCVRLAPPSSSLVEYAAVPDRLVCHFSSLRCRLCTATAVLSPPPPPPAPASCAVARWDLCRCCCLTAWPLQRELLGGKPARGVTLAHVFGALCDGDPKGLTAPRLVAAAARLPLALCGLSARRASQIFADIDTDSDGVVGLPEFADWVAAGCGLPAVPPAAARLLASAEVELDRRELNTALRGCGWAAPHAAGGGGGGGAEAAARLAEMVLLPTLRVTIGGPVVGGQFGAAEPAFLWLCDGSGDGGTGLAGAAFLAGLGKLSSRAADPVVPSAGEGWLLFELAGRWRPPERPSGQLGLPEFAGLMGEPAAVAKAVAMAGLAGLPGAVRNVGAKWSSKKHRIELLRGARATVAASRGPQHTDPDDAVATVGPLLSKCSLRQFFDPAGPLDAPPSSIPMLLPALSFCCYCRSSYISQCSW